MNASTAAVAVKTTGRERCTVASTRAWYVSSPSSRLILIWPIKINVFRIKIPARAIALAGILMRNTLILIGQIKINRDEGLDTYHALVEATVQRSRPVVLTATAAVLAFIPLTQSAFWGPLAYTLIGGTAVGTALTLLFLPALYAIWFRVRPNDNQPPAVNSPSEGNTDGHVNEPNDNQPAAVNSPSEENVEPPRVCRRLQILRG